MYESFYGLKEKPFSLLPDPAFLYLSKQHEMAMTLLEYSLQNQTGFCVVSGRAGTGKTTLLRQLLNRIGDDVSVGLISNTHHSFGELLRWILHAFSLEDSGKNRAELHQIFIDYLIRQYAKNQRTMLIIDEAQNMSSDSLEELRMLSNINSEKDLLLQVILVGQPPLREILRRPELEQFAQRVAVDYHLDSLGPEETKGYIRHRLLVAGGEDELFTEDACDAVFVHSGGIPRLINLLCDISLVYAYAEQAAVVTGELVAQVISEREKNGALPIFVHDRKPSASRNPATKTTHGAAKHASRKRAESGMPANVRHAVTLDVYGKALQPATGVSSSHRVHAMETLPARDVPVSRGAHGQTGAKAAGSAGVPEPSVSGLVAQEAHETGMPSGENAGSISGSVSAHETPRPAGQDVAPRNGRKHGKMPGAIEVEKTRPVPASPVVSPAQATAENAANTVNLPQDACGDIGHAKAEDTAAPKRNPATPGRPVARRGRIPAASPLKRYVPAAALVVLSLCAAFAWHVYKQPATQAALIPSVASPSPVQEATAAPVTSAANVPPVSDLQLQSELPGKPAVAPQAEIAPAAPRKDPLKAERKKLIERERAAAQAIIQAEESKREALREAVLAQQRALAAEHEAALARGRESAKQLALAAEKARESARATAATAAAAPEKPESMKDPAVVSTTAAVSSVPAAADSVHQKNAEADVDTDDAQTGEPTVFNANPCKGPSARFLSTCE